MSEYTQSIVLCDRCYPDTLPGFTYFPLEGVKGIFRGFLDRAQDEGWKEVDYGHICPDCAQIEEALAEDDGEVILGPPGFLGGNDEDEQDS